MLPHRYLLFLIKQRKLIHFPWLCAFLRSSIAKQCLTHTRREFTDLNWITFIECYSVYYWIECYCLFSLLLRKLSNTDRKKHGYAEGMKNTNLCKEQCFPFLLTIMIRYRCKKQQWWGVIKSGMATLGIWWMLICLNLSSRFIHKYNGSVRNRITEFWVRTYSIYYSYK